MTMGLLLAVHAEELDKRVTLQKRVETDDGGGGQTIAWTDTVTVWAKIEPGRGREFLAAQQLRPELSHMVTMRYRPTVTAKHRLKYLSRGTMRLFLVHAVTDPLERHERLVLYCSEEPATDATVIYPD